MSRENPKQFIERTAEFDYCHRVMNEAQKCFNIHGHRGLVELIFQFKEVKEIGYAIDFKEIKRIGCQWIDDMLDHGSLLNPKDEVLINACISTKSKYWLMSLNGEGNYCNPTAENIAKEIFLAMQILFRSHREYLWIDKVKFYETPNCYVICEGASFLEGVKFKECREEEIEEYAKQKGVVEYDDRLTEKRTTGERLIKKEDIENI